MLIIPMSSHIYISIKFNLFSTLDSILFFRSFFLRHYHVCVCACVAFNPPNAELDLSQNIKSRFCAVYLVCGVDIAHFALARMMVARASCHPPGVSISILGSQINAFCIVYLFKLTCFLVRNSSQIVK